MNFSFSFLMTALAAGAAKIPTTLLLATVPLLLGSLAGFCIALARFFRVPVLSPLFRWTVTIIKGIPVALILLLFYVWTASAFDPIARALGIPVTFRTLNKGLVAIAALLVYASVGLSEAFRGAFESIRRGQFDAGYAAGLSTAQVIRVIVVPQAFPAALPMISNIYLMLIKAAALASLVSVIDVMNAAVMSAANNYRFLEAYTAAALIYWAICAAIEKSGAALERFFSRKLRKE